jgi:hypothetical protein
MAELPEASIKGVLSFFSPLSVDVITTQLKTSH